MSGPIQVQGLHALSVNLAHLLHYYEGVFYNWNSHMKVTWDYSERSHSYDKRAEYSCEAIQELLNKMRLCDNFKLVDIGAGTGKLTKHLVNSGCEVIAVEPNSNMQSYGRTNVVAENGNRKTLTWMFGTAEDTGLPDNIAQAAFFGSSFNVVDQKSALQETRRIVRENGWFCCLWNHRDLSDPIQMKIEDIIKTRIPRYDYGKRREDPTQILLNSAFFYEVQSVKRKFKVKMAREDIIAAWRSHDTLYRQSGNLFNKIIDEISEYLSDQFYTVPYETCGWLAQFKE